MLSPGRKFNSGIPLPVVAASEQTTAGLTDEAILYALVFGVG